MSSRVLLIQYALSSRLSEMLSIDARKSYIVHSLMPWSPELCMLLGWCVMVWWEPERARGGLLAEAALCRHQPSVLQVTSYSQVSAHSYLVPTLTCTVLYLYLLTQPC